MEQLEIEKKEIYFELDGSNFRQEVENLEAQLINSGGDNVFVGNSEYIPQTHSFAEGIYIREIFIPKGTFVIGKIHKLHHSFFLIQGKLRMFSENGVKDLEAPIYGVAESGTKRVAYAFEDCKFINVFPNPNNIKEIDVLEDIYVSSSYIDYENFKLLNK